MFPEIVSIWDSTTEEMESENKRNNIFFMGSGFKTLIDTVVEVLGTHDSSHC
jgi:hypothetical protein